MKPEDVKEIGAKLTKAQRDRVLGNPNPPGGRGIMQCRKALQKMGLLSLDWPLKLTPLGLAVRATLEPNHE